MEASTGDAGPPEDAMDRRTITRKSFATLVAACAVATLAPAAPASAAPAVATSITLDRSGGFAGQHQTFLVNRSTPDGRPVLRLAGRGDFLRLRASYLPKNPCCDRFEYRLTVTYRGGFRKTVSTVQGTSGVPEILWTVISDVERVGAQP
ncbi:hypothetical protein [Actinoplanes philippinensis]|uniref:hypothetical protein n=1 Tax=Actinoplanes philippinensis TaxID=35752 RepID=UPI0033DD322B